jgi:vacuolar iron transporter family protein
MLQPNDAPAQAPGLIDPRRRERLVAEHQPEAIRRRLGEDRRHGYVSDAVLGGIDGCVTTFAVVAGSLGGGFSSTVLLVLGFANLIADGFSMAVSNYLGTKSSQDQVEQARREEEQHIACFPEGEREEIRQIFAQKGFSDDVLDHIVATITENRTLWVDTMITEELGLQLEGPHPLRAAGSTFLAFVLVGLIPLLPFLLPGLAMDHAFAATALATAAAFLGIGIARGAVLEQPIVRAGLETLLTGGAAAAIAYVVGLLLKNAFGV